MQRLIPICFALTLLCWAADAPHAQSTPTAESAAGGGVEGAVLVMPVSTTSEAAKMAFMEGLYALDMQRPQDARDDFRQAVTADPNFALGHLYLSATAQSLDESVSSLRAAEAAAPNASRSEQLMIESAVHRFDRDMEGALARLQELTTTTTSSPRAWLALADLQAAMGMTDEARNSIREAIDLRSDMAIAHIDAGESYLFDEPRDLDRAERHIKRAIELAPDEPMPYDLLGDVYRAQGNLEGARDAYTQASERAPDEGSPYQQRAHVNTFLGDYDAARADYDRAIELATGNSIPAYGVYRALVSVHAGQPAEAVSELKTLAANIDGMDIPEPTGLKLFALGTAANIALHTGMTDEAENLIGMWTELMEKQAESVGREEFTRAQQAQIEAVHARLAIHQQDADEAMEHVERMEKLVAGEANPRKMEPVHAIYGEAALMSGDADKAVMHLRQADVENDMRVKYLLAQALEAHGETEEAMTMYKDLATWYFNSPDIALVRKDAAMKAGM